MDTYLVTCNKPSKKEVKKGLKKFKHCKKVLDNTWIIKTNYNSDEIFKTINPNENNRCFIIKVGELDRQGWLAKNSWKFIKNNPKEKYKEKEEVTCCEECSSQTSNRLVAECGFSYVCSNCVDKVWEDSFHYDSDGRNVSMYHSYYD